MNTAILLLVPVLAATLAGLIRIVMGSRRLEWDYWDIDRAIAADQHLLESAPPTFAGMQYAALVRQLEGNTEGRPVIDTRAGVVDLTRLERDPSAHLVDDLITRDLQSQLGELRRGVVESQLAHQPVLSRTWLVFGDSDVTMLGGCRIERQVLRVVNLEDPSVQLHLTIRSVSVGLGAGGERSEIAALITDVSSNELPVRVRELLGGDGRVPAQLVARLGLRGTGVLRSRRAPGLSNPAIRRRVLTADPSAPVDRHLLATLRRELAASGHDLGRPGQWCRVGGPAIGLGLWWRFRSTVSVNASSSHWSGHPIVLRARGRAPIGVPPDGGPSGLAA